MIDRIRKVVFIHVPKTAGSSVEQALFKYIRLPILTFFRNHPLAQDVDEAIMTRWDGRTKIWRQHATAWELKDLYMSPKDFNEFFKFGFVRNPWSRALSAYKYISHKQGIEGSFIDFLNAAGAYESMRNKRNHREYRMDHLKSQYEFLFNTRNGKQLVDFIGRFENLQEDFNTVCSKIGISAIELPHFKKHKGNYKKHYTEYYDSETRDLVEEKYAKDIEVFDYEFGE